MANHQFRDEVSERLKQAARYDGYHIGAGARSQLSDYVEYLLDLRDAVRANLSIVLWRDHGRIRRVLTPEEEEENREWLERAIARADELTNRGRNAPGGME